MNGGIDHQSVGVGPYAPGATRLPTGGDYPNAVYYCSQSVAAAFCIRSDDGGKTFLYPSVLKTAADCDGFTPAIHGHVRVAPDGTVYVPDRNCGGYQAVIVSEDSGMSWQVRRLPGTTAGPNDSSVGIAGDGTLYYCYLSADAHVRAAVSKDRGLSWINDRDIGMAQGVLRAVFPNAIAGDPDRAACAFVGTRTSGNYQSLDFTGLWHVYAAMTYDGGNTWHTVDPNPADPVQGVGGICLGGTTCLENRNLLDFNEITLDDHGRVIYAYNDGCLGDCINTGIPNQTSIPGVININSAAKSTLLRQSGGRTLYAAFDTAEPAPPKAPCLSGGRDDKLARLVWKTPDNGGAEISGYQLYRGTAAGGEQPLAKIAALGSYEDSTVDAAVASYFYKITALNAQGEGIFSNTVELKVGDALPEIPGAPVEPPPAAAVPAKHGRFGSALPGALLLPLLLAAALRRRSRIADA